MAYDYRIIPSVNRDLENYYKQVLNTPILMPMSQPVGRSVAKQYIKYENVMNQLVSLYENGKTPWIADPNLPRSCGKSSVLKTILENHYDESVYFFKYDGSGDIGDKRKIRYRDRHEFEYIVRHYLTGLKFILLDEIFDQDLFELLRYYCNEKTKIVALGTTDVIK